MSTRRAHPIVDTHVGKRIRLRRKTLKLSQTELGLRVGVSFQQMQKYESGKNRVGASRLSLLAKALDVPVAYFFPPDHNFPDPLSRASDQALEEIENRIRDLLSIVIRLRQV